MVRAGEDKAEREGGLTDPGPEARFQTAQTMTRTRSRLWALLGGVLWSLAMQPSIGHAQATSRLCSGNAGETPGPACLVAHQALGALPGGPLYWRIYTFADQQGAERAKTGHDTVVSAFGRIWLFGIGGKGREIEGARHLADVGPLPMEAAAGNFSAEYLKSTFSPGMAAPVHVHSGPEAFYAISGASCLETPDGVQIGRGAGHTLIVQRGPPMLLVAIGHDTRRGFALILHEEGAPPTTLTSAWTPKGLCQRD